MNEQGYDTFESQLSEAVRRYPKLRIESGETGCFLRGDFDVIDDEGQHWDTFEIEVRQVPGFPWVFPKLYEVGGKSRALMPGTFIPRMGRSVSRCLPRNG